MPIGAQNAGKFFWGTDCTDRDSANIDRVSILDEFIHWLVAITVIEMMIAIGINVSWNELALVSQNRRLILASFFANYVCVPAAALFLIAVLRFPPLIGTGILILAVCPGSSYGPPITSFGKGNLPVSVGLMVLLAGSSAIVAPLLLYLLHLFMADQEPVMIDFWKVFAVLVVTQLAPLCVGLAIRHWRPALADTLKKPAESLGLLLNIAVIGLLLATHYELFSQLDLRGFVGMTGLLVISMASGWQVGGPRTEDRRALALVTSLRNAGLGLVIATGAFRGTPAVVAVLGYSFFEIVGSLLLALWWNRAGAGFFPAAMLRRN